MDAKNMYDGISRLLVASSARELPKPVKNEEVKSAAENGDLPVMENGETPEAKEPEATIADEEKKSPTSQTDQTDAKVENPA